MVEHGIQAGEASTAVACSGGARRDCHISASVYTSWAPLSLRLGSLAPETKLASLVPWTLALEAQAYVIWGVFWLDKV